MNIHALLKSPLITPNDYTIPEQLHYMLHMLLGISWYVYAMPISHSSPVDIPLTPRLGLLLKVLFISPPSLFFGLNFESFGTLMKNWVCLKIRYPKIRMVYHHSPHQKLPFGLYTPFPDAPRPGCESLDADALAIPSKVNCIPLVFGIRICLYIYMSIYIYV